MANPHSRWRAGVVAGSLGVALGCGAATPSQPNAPSPTPTVAEAPQRPPTAQAAQPAPSEPPSPDPGELGGEPTDTPVAADDESARAAKVETECSALCTSAAETCSRKSTRECRANCGKYQSLADRCEVQVLGAIRCQAAVPKFVCSNLVSECATEFQALSACEQGASTSEAGPAPSPTSVPAGWARVRDTEVGFEVALPLGARVGDLDGHRTWTADGPNGVSYRVAVLPALRGPATEKRLMETILDYLGRKCQPLVRMHGRFETDRDVAERFNARCESGQRWRGLMRASHEQLLVIVEVLPPSAEPAGDAYYYSFEYTGPQNSQAAPK